jgi:hypothetical protein
VVELDQRARVGLQPRERLRPRDDRGARVREDRPLAGEQQQRAMDPDQRGAAHGRER